MTDFGRRFGDMFKSTYDTDQNGVVDEVEAVPAHKTSHQNGGSDALDCSGLDGRDIWIERGDPSTPDFSLGALTTDGHWHDLDCSSIVPVDAKAIRFNVQIQDNAAFSFFDMRKNGNTGAWAAYRITTQVANIPMNYQPIVFCDTDRVVEYLAFNTTWSTIYITVIGWLI